jgi:hypothetical protein
MNSLYSVQSFLEDIYGIKTQLDVRDFVRSIPKLDNLGKLIIDQTHSTDPSVALLLDQDILSAWKSGQPTEFDNTRAYSVIVEELSHFVYFAYNHQRGRNITALEMEIQSEIDRILLAFHGSIKVNPDTQTQLLQELFEKPYGPDLPARYEESRKTAKKFLLGLVTQNPQEWKEPEFNALRDFFHMDLGGKIFLSQKKRTS